MKDWFRKIRDDSLVKTIVHYGVPAVGGLVAVFFPKVRDPIWNFLVATQTIPTWLVVLGSLPALYIAFKILQWWRRPAHVKSYQQDKLDGMTWRWTYKDGLPCNLTAHCCEVALDGKECGVRLRLTVEDPLPNSVPPVKGTAIYCPACNKGKAIFGTTDLADLELRKIERRIETGEWKPKKGTGKNKGTPTLNLDTQTSPLAAVSTTITTPTPASSPISTETSGPARSSPTAIDLTKIAIVTKSDADKKEPRATPELHSPTHLEIVSAIEKADPFHRSKIEKDFKLTTVSWDYRLSSIHVGSSSLQVTLEGEKVIIHSQALDPGDRTLATAKEGEWIRVQGKIDWINRWEVQLVDCIFERLTPNLPDGTPRTEG